ncbi:MAG: Lrp/AsnC family transcriptional regulator [Candidatus Thorarchaeota archaeon]
MDALDKTLLLKLLGNCRASYRRLAQELGVTCPTIKRRVDRLKETGVIERFTIDVSQDTLGVGWVYAEIKTDLSEDRTSFIREICENQYTNEIFAIGSKSYIAFAEVPVPDGVYEYGKFLRSVEGVCGVELFPVRQLPTSQLSTHSKYSYRGKKVSFSSQHLRLMKVLLNNARISILELSERVGFKPKRVRRILRELEESEGVHFTIRFNPAAEEGIGFILKISFNELLASPTDIAYWMEEEFPHEYWMSFLLSSNPIIVNYMTCDSLASVEKIIRRMKEVPFITDVETKLIYHIERPSEDGPLISCAALAKAIPAV